MIKVKSHTRKRKNGVSVVRQHMKKQTSKGRLQQLERTLKKHLKMTGGKVHSMRGMRINPTFQLREINSLRKEHGKPKAKFTDYKPKKK